MKPAAKLPEMRALTAQSFALEPTPPGTRPAPITDLSFGRGRLRDKGFYYEISKMHGKTRHTSSLFLP